MKELILKNDKYKMNWIEGRNEWGTVKCPEGLECEYSIFEEKDIITERFVFTNVSDKYVFTSLRDIAIYTTFNDDYKSAEICRTNRCHMHIWCGGEVSYVMALRMGGEAPHLGLVLTKGSIGGYSVERDIERSSNDRGDFLLHPSPAEFVPGESMTIEWKLFSHNGKADFYEKIKTVNPRFINITAENYAVFKGEEIKIEITPAFKFENAFVKCNGQPIEFTAENGVIKITQSANTVGERKYEVEIDGIKTYCRINVIETIEVLAERRCKFIAEKQQYGGKCKQLNGAYLIYDNEEEHIYYDARYDMNAARERVGMGQLMSEYLKHNSDEALNRSLLKYAEFVQRELFDEETGRISNDYGHDDSYFRLYNFPWYSSLFIQLYEVYGDKKYLVNAYKVMMSFYENGGAKFYAIEIPVCKLTELLKKNDMSEEYSALLANFEKHSEFLLECGLNYPAHEVNYEQSIVAPGTDILLQMYELTGDKKYLDGAEVQLAALELFNGTHPDYFMNETAIRHWDGFWFGKRRCFGDTLHYWSALTGNVYERYARLTGKTEYLKKAEKSFRGVLSLIFPNGRGSCAYLYPVSINGQDGRYFDEYANDQDWGLYFMLRHKNNK